MVSNKLKASVVRVLIVSWIADHLGLSTGGDIEFLYQAASNRVSPQARTLRALLFCHSKVGEALFNWKATLANDDYAKLAWTLLEQKYKQDHRADDETDGS